MLKRSIAITRMDSLQQPDDSLCDDEICEDKVCDDKLSNCATLSNAKMLDGNDKAHSKKDIL